jgi:CDP-glucose 4,6-dehydratase
MRSARGSTSSTRSTATCSTSSWLLEHGSDGPHALNFGPDDLSWTVRDVITALHEALGEGEVQIAPDPGPREAPALLLDSELAKQTLGWRPVLDTATALAWTTDWHRELRSGGDARALALQQIAAFEDRARRS